MLVNKRLDWSIGCKVVQHQLMMRIHKGMKTSPWEALTGITPRRGFSIPASAEMSAAIISEAQLERCTSCCCCWLLLLPLPLALVLPLPAAAGCCSCMLLWLPLLPLLLPLPLPLQLQLPLPLPLLAVAWWWQGQVPLAGI